MEGFWHGSGTEKCLPNCQDWSLKEQPQWLRSEAPSIETWKHYNDDLPLATWKATHENRRSLQGTTFQQWQKWTIMGNYINNAESQMAYYMYVSENGKLQLWISTSSSGNEIWKNSFELTWHIGSLQCHMKPLFTSFSTYHFWQRHCRWSKINTMVTLIG